MVNGISIVVTTWNRQALLERALRSIRKAKKNYLVEVVVVDDASDIQADISGFTDLNVRLIRQNENKGCEISRNIGVGASLHNWVAILDDDDELLPEAFYVLFKYLQDPNCANESIIVFTFLENSKKRKTERYFLKEYLRDLYEDTFFLINKSAFQPDYWLGSALRIGEYAMLCMRVALSKGFLLIDEPVAKTNHDTELRMCSVLYQIDNVSSYLDMYRKEIEFIEPYRSDFVGFYNKKILGYAVFSVFSDRKKDAYLFLKKLTGYRLLKLVSLMLLCVPKKCLMIMFSGYRKLFSGFSK